MTWCGHLCTRIQKRYPHCILQQWWVANRSTNSSPVTRSKKKKKIGRKLETDKYGWLPIDLERVSPTKVTFQPWILYFHGASSKADSLLWLLALFPLTVQFWLFSLTCGGFHFCSILNNIILKSLTGRKDATGEQGTPDFLIPETQLDDWAAVHTGVSLKSHYFSAMSKSLISVICTADFIVACDSIQTEVYAICN